MNTKRDPIELVAQRLRGSDLGLHVCVTRRLGGGFPHVVVGAHGHICLAFVRKAVSDLTEEEFEFKSTWAGQSVLMFTDPDQAEREVERWVQRMLARRV